MSSVAAGGPQSSSRSSRSNRTQARSTTSAAAATSAPRAAPTVNVPVTAISVAAPMAMATPTSPRLLAAVDRINAALEVAVVQPPPLAGSARVCPATEEEWEAYVDSDAYTVHPKFLDWFERTGEIHIIEFADTPHEKYIGEFGRRTIFDRPNVSSWLCSYMSARNAPPARRQCPDLSYGPRQTTPGSVLPANIASFNDFRTIKIEVGVSQPWGLNEGELDHKATRIWLPMAGVEYVLCIKYNDDFSNPEYKLYDVQAMPVGALAPTRIIAPRTVIHFDSRRVLGIPPSGALPTGFPSSLAVDVYTPLKWAMR